MSAACLLQRHVDEHFGGTISPANERRMREHLGDCAICRRRYERHALLATLDPEALPAEDRLGRGLGFGERPAMKRAGALLGAVSALAAAALVLFLVHPRAAEDAGYVARGGGHGERTQEAVVPGPVRIYRVTASGPLPVLDAVRRGDELAFRYENSDDKAYMMIFGVNDQGRVYWFYPAWTNEAETPTAIPIARSRQVEALPDAIRHDLTGTRLDVHALFTDTPLTVRAVEAAIAANTLPALGASDHVSTVRLEP